MMLALRALTIMILFAAYACVRKCFRSQLKADLKTAILSPDNPGIAHIISGYYCIDTSDRSVILPPANTKSPEISRLTFNGL